MVLVFVGQTKKGRQEPAGAVTPRKERTMDPEATKLEQAKIIEIPPTPAEGGQNPMQDEKVKVIGVNWRKLSYLLGFLLAIALFCVWRAMTPGKKLSAQELTALQQSKNGASNAQTPKPPDNIASMPGKYPDLHSPGVAGAKAQAVAPQGAASQGGAPPAGSAGAQGTNQPAEAAADGREQSAGGIKSFLSPQDQRQKDRISASRAPVAFDGRDARSPDPAPPRDTDALPSDPGGLNRILDRVAGGLGPAGADTDDQNRQAEKRGFTKENRDDFPYLKTTLLTPLSKYELKAGSIIPGVLLTGINSDLPGQITAQVRENVYDTVTGRYLLIPQGARLIGEYDSKISYGQERVLVVWTRIILPNGNSIGLEGMPGVDLSGYAGVGGGVNNHYGKLVAGVVLGSVIGAGAQVAVGGQGAANVPPSFPQLFVSGAAGNINQAGQQITQKNLNLQPTIEIAPGQKINIFLTKDLILRPFTD